MVILVESAVKRRTTEMSIYDDFEDALVDHKLYGNGNARLNDARQRMLGHPDYCQDKHHEAVFNAERTVALLRPILPVSSGMIMTGHSWFYTELWGQRPKWFAKLADTASVRALILAVRRAKTREIVRVIAHNPSSQDLMELSELGMRPY
jgi:hypothetical protein